MRGGKRPGAGRKRGPAKKKLNTYVLPVTMAEMNRRAATKKSMGALLDEVFQPAPMKKLKNKLTRAKVIC